MKVMILGAAGQIGKMVTDDLLTQTDFDLVLYGRNVSSRLSDKVSDRVLLVDGNFEEFDKIKENLVDVDAVYLNYVAGRSEERRVGKEFLYRRRIVIRRRAQHDVSQT